MADLASLKDQLSKLTLMEAAALVKDLEESWGVKANSGGGGNRRERQNRQQQEASQTHGLPGRRPPAVGDPGANALQ